MGLPWAMYLWRNSTEGGGRLALLMAIAEAADEDGMCSASTAQLAARSRLGARRAQGLLAELVAEKLIALIGRGGGRGVHHQVRLLVPENPAEIAEFFLQNPAIFAPFGRINSAKIAGFAEENPAIPAGIPAETPQELRALPAPPGPPLTDTGTAESGSSTQKQPEETESLSLPPVRDLTEGQRVVAQVTVLFEEAGIGAPTPASIGRWLAAFKARRKGTAEELVALLSDLLAKGLIQRAANRFGYVMSRVSTHTPAPRRRRAAMPQTLAAGGDSSRAAAARRLTEKSKARAGGGA